MGKITGLSAGCSELTMAVANRAARLLLIGVGPHARRTYLPQLMKLGPALGAGLAAVVELESRRQEAGAICGQHGTNARRCFVRPFEGKLPAEVRRKLDALVVEEEINAVIISTEPLV